MNMKFWIMMLVPGFVMAQEAKAVKSQSDAKVQAKSTLVKPIENQPLKKKELLVSITLEDLGISADTAKAAGASTGAVSAPGFAGGKSGGSSNTGVSGKMGPEQSYRGGDAGRSNPSLDIQIKTGGFEGRYQRGGNQDYGRDEGRGYDRDGRYRSYRKEIVMDPGEYLDIGRTRIVCDLPEYREPEGFQCSAKVCTDNMGWSDPCFFCHESDYWTKVEVGSTIEGAKANLLSNTSCYKPSTLNCRLVR